MITFGSALTSQAKKLMLLGSGELGKEVAIEAQRYGIEVIAVDAYDHAPAMQAAHRAYVIPMLDANLLRELIHKEKPDFIVPEIEAIATEELLHLEQEGFNVIPTARAANLTMNREGIRRLAAEELGLAAANYRFADTLEELEQSAAEIGFPCVIKPIMSSSGKGQSVVRSSEELSHAWEYAQSGKRGHGTRVIIEEFVKFDSEITLLTVRAVNGTLFCPPIGHIQKDGDYIESWQPFPISEQQWSEAKEIARKITDALGGYGIFGVELFLTPDRVYFSEVSPRPHDTGMVTMATQNYSEFALHVRAILGLPIPDIKLLAPGASAVMKADRASGSFYFAGLEKALELPETQLRLFGKPVTKPGRRMGVALSTAETAEAARDRAKAAAAEIEIIYL
ncbi:MAG: phosphoribosylglycinamide formyltransferase 2 [Paenibacillus sp. RIFOXYA1_FULL_44_5]|nr:MAG: phosphoribosylglycinamide formyltransferase 2 [Paenibacillus sp. RIFOXYA1_FULL_44_5]